MSEETVSIDINKILEDQKQSENDPIIERISKPNEEIKISSIIPTIDSLKNISPIKKILEVAKPLENIISNDDKKNDVKDIIKNIISSGEPSSSPTLSHYEDKELKNVKQKIIKEIVVPNYYNDVKCTITSRSKWRNSSNKAELLSKLLTGAATVIAFSAGAYPDYSFLSFIAGCVGTVAMVSQQFSSYAKGEEKERTQQANKILQVLDIESIPDIMNSA